jgi:hypothetical protein
MGAILGSRKNREKEVKIETTERRIGNGSYFYRSRDCRFNPGTKAFTFRLPGENSNTSQERIKKRGWSRGRCSCFPCNGKTKSPNHQTRLDHPGRSRQPLCLPTRNRNQPSRLCTLQPIARRNKINRKLKNLEKIGDKTDL